MVPRKETPEHQAGDTVQLTPLWSCTVDPSRDHGGRGGFSNATSLLLYVRSYQSAQPPSR